MTEVFVLSGIQGSALCPRMCVSESAHTAECTKLSGLDSTRKQADPAHLQGPLHFAVLVALNHVANLHIIESIDTDTAVKS